jgi:hypothetical protein
MIWSRVLLKLAKLAALLVAVPVILVVGLHWYAILPIIVYFLRLVPRFSKVTQHAPNFSGTHDQSFGGFEDRFQGGGVDRLSDFLFCEDSANHGTPL